jgi:hypothetical protein
MQRDNLDAHNDTVLVACEGCKLADAGEWDVWGHNVCLSCAEDWRDSAPTYGDIIAKYGNDDDSVRIYTAFTERWLERQRERMAVG